MEIALITQRIDNLVETSIPRWYRAWQRHDPGPDDYIEYINGMSNAYTFDRLVYTDSISSTLNGHSKTRVVKFRKQVIDLDRYLRVPVKPRAFPPRKVPRRAYPVLKTYKKFIEPKKLDGWSNKYFDKIRLRQLNRYLRHREVTEKKYLVRFQADLKLWLELEKRCKKRFAAYQLTFAKRLAKYERRMAILEKRKAIVRKWKKRPPLVFARGLTGLPENPYERELITKLYAPGTPLYLYDWWANYCSFQPASDCFVTMAPFSRPEWSSAGLPARVRVGLAQTGSDFLSGVVAELTAKVLSKTISKVHKQDVHIGNIIAERHQAMGLFEDVVRRVTEIASGKKRLLKSVGSFVKNPRKIANDFLAFQFGVAPVLADTYAAAQNLARYNLGVDEPVLSFRSNSKRDFDTVIATVDGPVRINGTATVSIVVRYRVSNDVSRFLSSYGLVNPLEIAWEVLPWSFVIDWLVPVGKYLSDQTATVGLTFETGVKTVTLDYDYHGSNGASFSYFDASPSNPLVQAQGSRNTSVEQAEGSFLRGSYHRNSKKRTVLTELGTLANPVVKNPFSWTHNLEALALSVQKLFK
jgi:hypothetical protein